MKKLSICVILAALILSVSAACSSENEEQENLPPKSSVSQDDTPADVDEPNIDEPNIDEPNIDEPNIDEPQASNAKIGFMTQEYIGDNIAEIPYIEYDGESNPVIDAINRSVNQGIQQIYDDFMSNPDDRSWMEIRSYPFTTDRFLQVVTAYNTYPTYGTSGDLFSINYDRQTNEWIDIDYALSIEGMINDDLLYEVGEAFVPSYDGEILSEVFAAGFRILEDGSELYTEFLLEITTENPDGDPLKSFYSYIPKHNSSVGYALNELSPFCLFDPYDMDQMNPPLSYHQE